MAATLACGEGAALSDESAAALWRMRDREPASIHVAVPAVRRPHSRDGLTIHRRRDLDTTTHRGIRVTTPVATLVDLAPALGRDELEAAINEADKRDLVSPPAIRAALDALSPRPGVAMLKRVLDERTFVFTDSALERAFNRLARRAGLPRPQTRERVNGFRVDFYWPDLGLVVETDGLTYHRTPAQQARDRIRDQAHLAAGLAPLRFTHGQIRYDPAGVELTLRAVARRRR